MGIRKAILSGWFTLVLGGSLMAGIGWAEMRDLPFPSYGSGPVEVRLFADYFCSPCRDIEPEVEPILKELLKQNMIRLTLVDVPHDKLTPLYARNYLYAIRENNDPEHSFRVRSILQGAAAGKDVKTQEQIEALFKEKGVSFSLWDTKPAFDRYNALIKEDNIQGTPVCIVIKNGQKKFSMGKPNVIKAIKALP